LRPLATPSAILNFAAFQAAWLASVCGAAWGFNWLGPAFVAALLAVHIARSIHPRREALFILAVGVFGSTIDTGLAAAGVFEFSRSAAGAPILCPLWLVFLWLAFASTLNVSLRWLRGRSALASMAGLVFAPLSYWAGARLGALTFSGHPLGDLAIIGSVWAILLPLLIWVSAKGIRHIGARRRLASYMTVAPKALGFVSLIVTGCASVPPQVYEDQYPVFDMRSYFNGPVEAWGIFQDRSGKVSKRFHVDMACSWKGNVGTLDEHFKYSDGAVQQRVWTMTWIDEHHYTGTAADVVGTAHGDAYGNALRWRYVLDLPVGERRYDVHFDDWMYLMDGKNVMINRSVMSKFGIRLGEVTLFFRKVAAS
jgi:hypothetical protein